MRNRLWWFSWVCFGLCCLVIPSMGWSQEDEDQDEKAKPAKRRNHPERTAVPTPSRKAEDTKTQAPVGDAQKKPDTTRKETAPPPARRVLPPQSPMVTAKTGAALYQQLVNATDPLGAQKHLFAQLQQALGRLTWQGTQEKTITGNLRYLQRKGEGEKSSLYLLREQKGRELFILALPKNAADLQKGSTSPYADLHKQIQYKMSFKIKVTHQRVGEQDFAFAWLVDKPKRGTLDRLFFIAIIALLFFVMVGMGLTLTPKDFALVFTQPRGMLIGPLCQFGLLPLIAFALGKMAGFHESFPYIFAGMILVTASPGGVTSNFMTYLAKGDVALSVSLTAFSTVLSIVFTPFLLSLYVSGIPQLSIPVGDVVKSILVLVLIPLIVGMIIRGRAPGFAQRSEKFFSGLGIFALLFLIVIGVLANLEKFADTDRYGFQFYAVIFVLTFLGMFLGGFLAKLFVPNNAQVRAIALETGLQNSSLAMTIAILLQDRMGDFYSSMFFTSGIFGLWMYVSSALAIWSFPYLFPSPRNNPLPDEQRGKRETQNISL